MENPKTQLVDKLKSSTNILVTVSRNPSVDQLAACIGLTLLLNKFGKHATAVFSGAVPSTLEFLQPGDTLEKNTDSLRDFIIALDKAKADKLRYKVEDDMVRIFITPFRTSITDKDLEFSQGDFNVDVVIALGVTQQEDFDDAITAHGRILHDATVSSINVTENSGALGSIVWNEPQASSLSELVVDLAHGLGDDLIDGQIATAFLTGIVAETARFSNEKTTPITMSVSAELMGKGANQQLVATKLDEEARPLAANPSTEAPATDNSTEAPKDHDGSLEIDHGTIDAVLDDLNSEAPQPEAPIEQPLPPTDTIEGEAVPRTSKRIIEPPSRGGTLTANSAGEVYDPATDPLTATADNSGNMLLSHDAPAAEAPTPADLPPIAPEAPAPIEIPAPVEAPAPLAPKVHEPLLTGFTPPPPAWVPPSDDSLSFNQPDDGKTLSQIEQAVHSPHIDDAPAPAAAAPLAAPEAPAPAEELNDARDEVLKALNADPGAPAPIQALNAQPLGPPLQNAVPSFDAALQQAIPTVPAAPADPYDATHELVGMDGLTMSSPPPMPAAPALAPIADPNAPPPVPPPIPFNFGPPPPPPPAA